MKWDNVYVLTFQSDDDLSWKTAFSLCLRYDIPLERIAVFQKKNILEKDKNFLSASTLQSKIIVLAHGTPDYIDCSPFGLMSPVQFLLFLYNELGLRCAGIISFKSCYLGSGFFLEKCSANCELLFKDLKVGWWKAYKGVAATHFLFNSCSFSSGEDDYILRKKTEGGEKLSDDFRVKIIRGNHDVSPCDIRGARWRRLINQR
ncbi:TPA: hypothetical protein RXP34_003275 [Escherichia coli]|nr:hypothetical protein [Escherichia coli]HDQ6586837.1 hypothetical protein [Escherichia coli O187:H28]EFH0337984.1 hypothetical protein [Escherichia coli]EJS1807028.1 hypothetical protein [Escherichia coli]EKA0629066.1 hypothetical protein [Escherichia coli]